MRRLLGARFRAVGSGRKKTRAVTIKPMAPAMAVRRTVASPAIISSSGCENGNSAIKNGIAVTTARSKMATSIAPQNSINGSQ